MSFKEERHPISGVIIGDSPVESELIRSMLEHDLNPLDTCSTEDARQRWPHREDLGVVVLAIQDIAVAEEMVRVQMKTWKYLAVHPQLVLLCGRDTVVHAYELCRELPIVDYVVFWPVSLDSRRLQMAVYHAGERYLAAAAENANTDTMVETPGPEPTGAAPSISWSAVEKSDIHVPAAEAPKVPPGFGSLPPPKQGDRSEVLVVDDNKSLQVLVIDTLRTAGYEAYGASGAEAALRTLRLHRPAVILLDVDMPKVSGIELLQQLKADSNTRTIPVIMLSGLNRRDIVMDACRAGAIDFIAKPFKRDQLLHKLQLALRREQNDVAAVMP